MAGITKVLRALRSAALLLLVAVVPVACRSSESAIARGDRFWADSNYVAALAEYRLGLTQNGGDPATMARVAHAYAKTGQLDRAREEYDHLVKLAPEYADQAVFDFLGLAREANARADRYSLARSVEAALDLRPGLALQEFATPLARYYASSGDADRALEYFERALAYEPADAAPRLLFEIASVNERQGDCAQAMGYYRSFLNRRPYGDSAAEARFRLGSCAFEQGKTAAAAGQPEQALEYFTTVIEYGSPPNLQDQAWFERAEALLQLGRTEDAIINYRTVLELSGARETQLTVRARRRIQEVLAGLSRTGIGMLPPVHDRETRLSERVY